MFRNQNLPCGPGGKSGSLPDAELWALSLKPVEDRGLVMFVGNQKSVWLREVCFSSRITQENTLSYVDFTECD
jgi:hypothetical protein